METYLLTAVNQPLFSLGSLDSYLRHSCCPVLPVDSCHDSVSMKYPSNTSLELFILSTVDDRVNTAANELHEDSELVKRTGIVTTN